MTKKPRENRVPIMMSDEELTAIDDWRFANRVATRSDAVRRLAQTTLRVDESTDRIYNRVRKAYAQILSRSDMIGEMLQADPPDDDQAMKLALLTFSDLVKELSSLMIDVRSTAEQVRRLRSPGEVADLTKDADKVREDAKRRARMMRLAFKALENRDRDDEDEDNERARS